MSTNSHSFASLYTDNYDLKVCVYVWQKKKGEKIMFIESHVSIPLKYLYFINFGFNSLNE